MTEIIDTAMQESLKRYIEKTDANPEREKMYIHFYQLAKQNGVVPFRLERIAEKYTGDYFADTGIPREEKEWYYGRGYSTDKTIAYGLNKENYNDYISDFDFYAPENYLPRSFIPLFDHKLNTYYLLSPFKDAMPTHYFYRHKGNLLPLNWPCEKVGSVEDVFSLLEERPLAFKACKGGHGVGFYKVIKEDDHYLLNGEKKTRPETEAVINSLEDYIITDYAIPHKLFREACGEGAFAVMRVITVYDYDEGPSITAMIIRLGTKAGGFTTDNVGTIYCGVNLENGELFCPRLRTRDLEGGGVEELPIDAHPDTCANLESLSIPNFDKICDLVKKISGYLPMAPYLVMDIIPTDNGFSLLEINSHGQVRNTEPYYPFRKNRHNLKVFQTRDR